jgi:multiple sugar transport system permease protein
MTDTAAPSAPASRMRLDTVGVVWLGVACILALMAIFPLLYMLSIAFKGPTDVFKPDLLPPRPTLDNFIYVLTEVPFWRYLINTFVVSAVVTVLALFFHTMAGYALARLRFPGRETLFLAMFSTFLVSLPVIIVPLFILVRSLGMLNSWQGLIVPAIFNAFGIFLLRQFYIGMPRELEDAAFVDGCGYWGVYRHVILPLSRPILAALTVFFFLANWNSFLWPLTITTNENLWMIQVAIASFQTQYAGAWNYIMAAATVAAIPTMALFFVFQRQLVESIKTSGFK